MRKNQWILVLLILCLVPLWFINRSNTLDWGDDNIQFIYQSKHLFDTRNYKMVVNSQDYAPVKRGILFSSILALNTSGGIVGYKNITGICYIICGIVLFLFFSSFIPIGKAFSWYFALLTITEVLN
jgi:hypothetical protein